MQMIFRIIKCIVLAILLFLAGICISVFIQTKVSPNKIPSVFGYKPFIVMSGSMEAELYKGDLAIVKNVDKSTLKKSDIIAFRDDKKTVVTHRIVEVTKENGKKAFITKGDNNNTNDAGVVYLKDIEGKYIFKFAGLGSLFLVLQKPITLFIILAIIIIIGIIWILLGNNKLSIDERLELEQLRKEKNNK